MQRSDGDADQAQNGDIERRQQATDLPVAAFVEDDFQPGVLCTAAEFAYRYRAEVLSVDHDAGLQPCE